MSTEDHARIQWVKLPSQNKTEKQEWWPALFYNNMDEAMKLSTSDTRLLGNLFVKSFSYSEGQSIAFLLGDIADGVENFVYVDNVNDENYVRSFYEYFGRFFDESNVSLKSAIVEAVERIRVNQVNLKVSQQDTCPSSKKELKNPHEGNKNTNTKSMGKGSREERNVVTSTEVNEKINTYDNRVQPNTKRARGRPKKDKQKSVVGEDDSQRSVDLTASPCSQVTKKGRGKPRKDQQNSVFSEDDSQRSVDTAASHCSQVTKKGRGKPRKDQQHSVFSEDDSQRSVDTAASHCSQVTKKGRGRPKKYYLNSVFSEDDSQRSVDSAASPCSQVAKKGRDRSKKDQYNSVLSEDDSQRSVDTAASPCSQVTKKGRGRPKKYEQNSIYAHDTWKIVWEKLRYSGWTLKYGSKNDLVDLYYIPPGGKISSGTKNTDYFTSEEELKAFVMEKHHWNGAPRTVLSYDFCPGKDFASTWSKLQILGWRVIESHDRYVAPGGVVRDGKEGVDYFTTKKKLLAYIRENCEQGDVLSETKTTRKRKGGKGSKVTVIKKSVNAKTLKQKKGPVRKETIIVKEAVKVPKKRKEIEKKSSIYDNVPLLEDEDILDPQNSLHKNYTLMWDFLNNVLDQPSNTPKLIHAVGGPGKTLTVTMSCKEFAKQNPMKKMTTVYQNVNRKGSIKQLMFQIGFVMGLSPFASTNVIENSLKTRSSMLITIIDEADIILSKDPSILKDLFHWAYSPEYNFALILVSNTMEYTKCMSLIPQGWDIHSKQNLIFPGSSV